MEEKKNKETKVQRRLLKLLSDGKLIYHQKSDFFFKRYLLNADDREMLFIQRTSQDFMTCGKTK